MFFEGVEIKVIRSSDSLSELQILIPANSGVYLNCIRSFQTTCRTLRDFRVAEGYYSNYSKGYTINVSGKPKDIKNLHKIFEGIFQELSKPSLIP